MKFIYLIQNLSTSEYKIGVSKNPSKRIELLQTGNGAPLKLIDTYRSEYAYKIETALHHRFSHLHAEGEWYRLSIEEETSFKAICKIIEDRFVFLKENHNVFI